MFNSKHDGPYLSFSILCFSINSPKLNFLYTGTYIDEILLYPVDC